LTVVFRHRDFATTQKFYGAKRKAEAAGDELRKLLSTEGAKTELVGKLEQLATIDPESSRS
jgi:hypothetical protein